MPSKQGDTLTWSWEKINFNFYFSSEFQTHSLDLREQIAEKFMLSHRNISDIDTTQRIGTWSKGGMYLSSRVNIQTTYVIVPFPRQVPKNTTFMQFRGSLFFSNNVLSFYIFLLSCRTDNIVEKHIVLMWPFYTMSNKDKTFSFETQQKWKVKSISNLTISQHQTKIKLQNTTKTKCQK